MARHRDAHFDRSRHVDEGLSEDRPGDAIRGYGGYDRRQVSWLVSYEANPCIESDHRASQGGHLAPWREALHELELPIRFHVKDDEGRVRSKSIADHHSHLRMRIRRLFTHDARLDSRREARFHLVDELARVPKPPNVRTRALNREGVLDGLRIVELLGGASRQARAANICARPTAWEQA